MCITNVCSLFLQEQLLWSDQMSNGVMLLALKVPKKHLKKRWSCPLNFHTCLQVRITVFICCWSNPDQDWGLRSVVPVYQRLKLSSWRDCDPSDRSFVDRCEKLLSTLERLHQKNRVSLSTVFWRLLVSLLQEREHPGEGFFCLDHQEQESLT